jgi:hypothetical protein
MRIAEGIAAISDCLIAEIACCSCSLPAITYLLDA